MGEAVKRLDMWGRVIGQYESYIDLSESFMYCCIDGYYTVHLNNIVQHFFPIAESKRLLYKLDKKSVGDLPCYLLNHKAVPKEGMVELFNRNLEVGDLVLFYDMVVKGKPLSRYGILVNNTTVYTEAGIYLTPNIVYKVENPTEDESKLLEKLKKRYKKVMTLQKKDDNIGLVYYNPETSMVSLDLGKQTLNAFSNVPNYDVDLYKTYKSPAHYYLRVKIYYIGISEVLNNILNGDKCTNFILEMLLHTPIKIKKNGDKKTTTKITMKGLKEKGYAVALSADPKKDSLGYVVSKVNIDPNWLSSLIWGLQEYKGLYLTFKK